MKISDKLSPDCANCPAGKMTEYISREPDERACKRLDIIQCDLAGPIDSIFN